MDDWLRKTRELQILSYGQDPAELMGKDLQFYVIWNSLAAVKEISEATDETRWKPWAVLEEGEEVIDKDAFLKEIVDVNHFLANLLVAAGVSDEEYWAAYEAKMQVNRERMARDGGYQSRRGVDKCVNCLRSFDDVSESKVIDQYCVKCETEAMGKRS